MWDESKHPRDSRGRFIDRWGVIQKLWLHEDDGYIIQSVYDGDEYASLEEQQAWVVEITKITDNAIDRVPVVKIPGYTEEECEFIADQHKELLRYARDNNDNKEVAFVFRQGFSERIIVRGADDNIDFNQILLNKGSGLVVLHNHPRNKSFSLADLSTFIRSDNIHIMTIVKNNGIVETLVKNEGFNRNQSATRLNRIHKKYNQKGTTQEQEKICAKFLEGENDITWTR